MEVALAGGGTDDAVLFEVVVEGLGTEELARVGELELSVLAKAGCIAVLEGARVSKSFENVLC